MSDRARTCPSGKARFDEAEADERDLDRALTPPWKRSKL